MMRTGTCTGESGASAMRKRISISSTCLASSSVELREMNSKTFALSDDTAWSKGPSVCTGRKLM